MSKRENAKEIMTPFNGKYDSTIGDETTLPS